MKLEDLLWQAFPRASTPAEQLQVVGGLLVALALAVAAYFVVRRTGHPIQRLGSVVYVDDGRAATLYHAGADVDGRPDFVVWAGPWLWKEHRPVEYKTSRLPRTPYAGHVLQLAGYGLLIEAETGKYPRVGYLVYDHDGAPKAVKVRLGPRARALTLKVVATIREGRYPEVLPVDGRCRGCRQAANCPILARHSAGVAMP